MFSVPRAASRTRSSAACASLCVPLRAHARRPLELAPLRLRVEPVQLDRLLVCFVEPVHADDHALACLDLLLVAEGGLLDLVLDEPCSIAATAPPSSSIRSISSDARRSSSSVSASMK